MTSLARAVYKTLAFFDAQDMPLTLLETREYLGEKAAVGVTEIENVLNSETSGLVEHRDGFYFLRGREELVELRKRKYRVSLQNFRKAKKYLRFLRFFPYLRAVAISGSLALLNSSDNSDIDLFVITKKNRIWLTRFLISLYFQILGVRRHGGKIRGRFCLNHYLSEGQAITTDQNLYTAVEYMSLMPVLGRSSLEKFWQENAWIAQYIPPPLATRLRNGQGGGVGGEVEFSPMLRIFEIILDWSVAPLLNYLSGLYQKRRIRQEEHILVADSELSFHPGSRGQKVLAKFAQTLYS